MWLINTTTLELHEFTDARQAPGYAILSHRWGTNEVSFEDYRKDRNQTSSGLKKITDYCAFVRKLNHQWAWIDTCCIDKRSSAELSEAINSMFHWYERAAACFAYLQDVTASPGDDEALMQQFRKSAWWTRGWTLQELIAPRVVCFVNANWEVIGYKGNNYQPSLNQEIEDISAIPIDLLAHSGVSLDLGAQHGLAQHSVARRMSWIAQRATTRQEDMAYCMLGIFGINMPLLYGEGANALLRLQKEIFNRTLDESVFALNPGAPEPPLYPLRRGLFAEHFSDFVSSADIQRLTHLHTRPSSRLIGPLLEIDFDGGAESGVFTDHAKTGILLLRLTCARRIDGQLYPCILCLLQQSCGHYSRVFFAPEESERDINATDDWRSVAESGRIYVHVSGDGMCPSDQIQGKPLSVGLGQAVLDEEHRPQTVASDSDCISAAAVVALPSPDGNNGFEASGRKREDVG